jgi:hypothetical protein
MYTKVFQVVSIPLATPPNPCVHLSSTSYGIRYAFIDITLNSDFTYLLTYLLTHSLTHSLTPHSTVLLEKLTGLQPVKKFPAFYGTRRFITAFTSACHLSLS